MTVDPKTYQRAQTAALLGLITQTVLALVSAALGASTGIGSIQRAAWLLAGGVPIWVNLFLLCRQHRLERIEALERSKPGLDTASTASLFAEFEHEPDQARQRLDQLYQWGFHLTSLLTGLFLLAIGGLGLWRQPGMISLNVGVQDVPAEPLMPALVLAALVFVSFIVARYEAGMAGAAPWQMLRAGAAYLMGNLLVLTLLLLGAILAEFEFPSLLANAGRVIDFFMVVLGAEFLLALVMNLYRPRRPGQEPRPSFDSRLLGWLAQPQSIAKLVSETLSYQFGVDLSRHWAYQFALRAVIPLSVLGLLTLWALSCVVIVAPHEQALILHFGRLTSATDPAAQSHAYGPGLYFKLPWPFGQTIRFPVGRVRQLVVGSSSVPIDPDKALLWTNQHSPVKEEYLVTAPTLLASLAGFSAQETLDKAASGVGLISVRANLQYRVLDLPRFLRATQDTDAALAGIAERRLNATFLSKDIDTLLGPGRLGIGDDLKQQIQHDADEQGLGIEILFVGLLDIHPPPDQGVAAAFLEQINAQQQQHSAVEEARQAAIESLSAVAGSYDQAQAMNRLISDLEQRGTRAPSLDASASTSTPDPTVSRQEADIERLMISCQGLAAQVIHQAYADRWQKAILERAKADRFSAELAAYRYAPRYYRARQYLDALSQSLAGARKYVMRINPRVPPIFRIDLKDAGSAMEQILQDAHE